MKLIFPTDFLETPHRMGKDGKQWKPLNDKLPIFISVVGGLQGLYGNGTSSFELMIGEKVHGWLSAEEVTTEINKVLKLLTY